jgi:hypothetical protein
MVDKLTELRTQIALTHEILEVVQIGTPAHEASKRLLADMYKKLNEMEPMVSNKSGKPLLSEDSL